MRPDGTWFQGSLTASPMRDRPLQGEQVPVVFLTAKGDPAPLLGLGAAGEVAGLTAR